MKHRAITTAVLAALVLAATGASAQSADVVRRTYTFVATDLEIHVVASTPGRLRLMHGGWGEVDVTGRSPDGIVATALSDGNGNGGVLTLTTLGGSRADFIVVVPPEVRVQIRLPGATTASVFDRTHDVTTYPWPAQSDTSSARPRTPR
jgi:hypothetical protein